MIGSAQLCGLGLHRPGEDVVLNGSLAVSTCARCGKEIVRRDAGLWRTVPRGKRIVWRVPDADEMTWPTQNLPPA